MMNSQSSPHKKQRVNDEVAEVPTHSRCPVVQTWSWDPKNSLVPEITDEQIQMTQDFERRKDFLPLSDRPKRLISYIEIGTSNYNTISHGVFRRPDGRWSECSKRNYYGLVQDGFKWANHEEYKGKTGSLSPAKHGSSSSQHPAELVPFGMAVDVVPWVLEQLPCPEEKSLTTTVTVANNETSESSDQGATESQEISENSDTGNSGGTKSSDAVSSKSATQLDNIGQTVHSLDTAYEALPSGGRLLKVNMAVLGPAVSDKTLWGDRDEEEKEQEITRLRKARMIINGVLAENPDLSFDYGKTHTKPKAATVTAVAESKSTSKEVTTSDSTKNLTDSLGGIEAMSTMASEPSEQDAANHESSKGNFKSKAESGSSNSNSCVSLSDSVTESPQTPASVETPRWHYFFGQKCIPVPYRNLIADPRMHQGLQAVVKSVNSNSPEEESEALTQTAPVYFVSQKAIQDLEAPYLEGSYCLRHGTRWCSQCYKVGQLATACASVGCKPHYFERKLKEAGLEHCQECKLVSCLTYSQLLEFYDVLAPDLLQLDCEGQDYNILRSVLEHIRKYGPDARPRRIVYEASTGHTFAPQGVAVALEFFSLGYRLLYDPFRPEEWLKTKDSESAVKNMVLVLREESSDPHVY